ncbi:MAG: hypothetical protein IJ588_12500 [Prevotella sp.]|nr:hypothetical protein [Prevotella sp.]
MDITVSQKTAKLARQYRLRPQDLAFADLVAVGWEPEDAWAAAVREGVTWTKTARKQALSDLLNAENVQDRINDVKAVLRKNQIEAVKNASDKDKKAIVNNAMSKENMLYDLQTALESMTIGSKEWLDTKKMIIDVTRMKQDEVKDDNNTIHHFLPVHYPTGCQDCLYSRCDTCKYKKSYREDS